MKPSWYWRRLQQMSLAEVLNRTGARLRQRRWRRADRRPDELTSLIGGCGRVARVALPLEVSDTDDRITADLIASADQLLAGEMVVFGRKIPAYGPELNWFSDPTTGRSSDPDTYCFDVPYRDETKVGNIKFVWEPSRLLPAMQLASAWRLSGRDAYAERAAFLLTTWWRDNPFLQGVHWVSAIEAGLRLLSWTWIRALLNDWPGCDALFDANPVFLTQLYHHQIYVRTFRSYGSSANNHLLAEMAGLATASVAFPWFAESADWAAYARAHLVEQAAGQTFPDGFNREQAMGYHLFALDILLAAGLAARLAGQPLARHFDEVVSRMADALAASLDAAGRPPRFGDCDDGRALALDGDPISHVSALLGAGEALCGPASWWPPKAAGDSVLRRVAASLVPDPPPVRDRARPSLMPDAGHAFLRCGEGSDEIWLRCDHGRLGYLAIAAHGHADALSVELRVGGVEVLADPGTYCYHGNPDWRRYFKGTLGHNTLTVDGRDQAENGGPFLWTTDVSPRLEKWDVVAGAGRFTWQASHDGYLRLNDPVIHHRRVEFHPVARSLDIIDWIEARAAHEVTLAYHFGPAIVATVDDDHATISWSTAEGLRTATIRLPPSLQWALVRGATSPPRGWYSAGFARKEPTFTLLGHGPLRGGERLTTSFGLTIMERTRVRATGKAHA